MYTDWTAANVFFYSVDITSPTAIQEAATQIREEYGEPTVLINNAGVGYMGNIIDKSESNIRRILEVNTLSHFWMVKEFLPAMIKNDHGHIVTIASMASFAALNGMADYASSKAAVLAFHESLTQEIRHSYGAKRVRTRYAYALLSPSLSLSIMSHN
jgi:short-subunit dehydrogenase